MAGIPPINAIYNNTVAGNPSSTPVSQLDPRLLAAKMLTMRLGMYRTFSAYYNGQHRLAFASEKFRNAFGRLFFQFADNLCPSVVDSVSDRLKVIDWSVKGATDPSLGKAAWEMWQEESLELVAEMVHQEALRSGDGYVIVWPDQDGKPCFYPQIAEQITVYYDDENPGKMLWAAKSWINPDGFIRLNMYYADTIEKWITVRKMGQLPQRNTNVWRPFMADGETWPLINKWGRVPVFHFINNAPPGRFGRSELKDALPIQDALNKSVIDMLVAMEYVSLPQRYATGIELEVDEDQGLPELPFQPSVDRVWTVADKDAQFGQFPAADLTQLLAVQNDMRLEMARVTGTPLHYMMAIEQPPSGEALKTLEDRLVKKVYNRQVGFGNTWAAAMVFALQIAQDVAPDTKLAPKWTNPAPKSSLEEAQTQQIKKVIGVSTNQVLSEMGYTESEIEQMAKDNEEEQKQKLDQQVQQAQAMAIAVPDPLGGQSQPPGKTSPAVQPAPDGQRLDKKGKPTTAKPVSKQG